MSTHTPKREALSHPRRCKAPLCLLCSLLAGCLLACADEPAASNRDASAAEAQTGGDGSRPEDDFVGCPEGVPGIVSGLSAMGKQLAINVVSAMPSALERFINGWTVELRTLDGSPASDATIVRAQTFMPLHGHDGGVVPRFTVLGTSGRIQVDRLNFIMRGPWEVRFWLRSSTGEEDYVVFNVCVAR